MTADKIDRFHYLFNKYLWIYSFVLVTSVGIDNTKTNAKIVSTFKQLFEF